MRGASSHRPRIVWAACAAALCASTAGSIIAVLEAPSPAAPPSAKGRLELVGAEPLLGRGMNAALAVHGRYAYVGSRTDGTHRDSGVLVVDISKPSRPRVVHEIGPPAEANPGESSRELRVWPEKGLLIVMNFQCERVGHACAGSADRTVEPTFRFYDIRGRRARSPRLLSAYRPSRNPHEFFLWDDPRRRGRALLYISTPFVRAAEIDATGPHLVVTDISRARQGRFRELVRWSPRRESRYDEAGLHSLSVSYDGRRAYLADLEGGFEIADTSELADRVRRPRIRQLTPPQSAVHHEAPGVHSAVPVPGRRQAFITDEVYGALFGVGPVLGFNVLKGCPWGWSRVIDVDNPRRPRVAGEYKVLPYNDPAQCSSVTSDQQNGASFSSHNPTLTPNLALVTWHSAGLQVAVLPKRGEPVKAAAFRPRPLDKVATEDPALSGLSEKVVMWSYPIVKDGLVYVVDLRNGLYVLRYRGPFATELGCHAFLEGNSNLVRRIPRCGLRLRLALRFRPAAFGESCAGSEVRATLRGADMWAVRRVDFLVGGRRLASDGRPPFSQWITRRNFDARHSRLVAVASVRDGSRVPITGSAKVCR
jgi:hypothetical protein